MYASSLAKPLAAITLVGESILSRTDKSENNKCKKKNNINNVGANSEHGQSIQL